MTKLRCGNCDYIFESESTETRVICPYCGKKEVKKELSAEELIKNG